LLNQIRIGKIPAWGARMLKELGRQPSKTLLEPTYLYATNKPVRARNEARLASLVDPPVYYEARNSINTDLIDIQSGERQLSTLPAIQMLSLKLGAQVMLIKNVDETLVNGTVGVVCAFWRASHGHLAGANIMDEYDTPKSQKEYVGKLWRKEEPYPVVKFTTSSGDRTVIVGRHEFRSETYSGQTLVCRIQVCTLSSLQPRRA
ncbi:uncharacterized protein SCHCODRAFT_02493888, partial [Schizophyllum commune H4-8]|uniref:uncharacterized protein n=1 Tax=Schizophyllum commune (strain H4-8 / FGSC 9210) TaxID=578458 RepID=UPI00215FF707